MLVKELVVHAAIQGQPLIVAGDDDRLACTHASDAHIDEALHESLLALVELGLVEYLLPLCGWHAAAAVAAAVAVAATAAAMAKEPHCSSRSVPRMQTGMFAEPKVFAATPESMLVTKACPGRGRGLFVTANVPAGTVLIDEPATGYAPHEPAASSTCAFCGDTVGTALDADGESGEGLRSCFCAKCAPSRLCTVLANCHRRLRVSDGSGSDGMTTELRLALALVVAAMLDGSVEQQLRALAAADDEGYDAIAREHAVAIEQLVEPIAEAEGLGALPAGLAEHAMRSVLANAFGVRESGSAVGEGSTAGRALFMRSSSINHCCSGGNATFAARLMEAGTPPRILVRSVRPLAAGDEVTIGYSSSLLFQPTAQRRDALRARFGFVCACVVCTGGAGQPSEGLDSAAASPAAEPPHSALCGRRARLHGLVSRSDLNGCVGTLCEFNEEKGRYAVEVEDAAAPGGDGSAGALLAERVLLRLANLELEPPPERDGALCGASVAQRDAAFDSVVCRHCLHSAMQQHASTRPFDAAVALPAFSAQTPPARCAACGKKFAESAQLVSWCEAAKSKLPRVRELLDDEKWKEAVALLLDTLRRDCPSLHLRSTAAYVLHGALLIATIRLGDPRAAEATYRSARTCIAVLEATFEPLRDAAAAAAGSEQRAGEAADDDGGEEVDLALELGAHGELLPNVRTLASLYELAARRARSKAEAHECAVRGRGLQALCA